MSGPGKVLSGGRRIGWLGAAGIAAIVLAGGCAGRWTEDWKEMAAIEPVGRGWAMSGPAAGESEIVEAEVDEGLFDEGP